MLEKHKIREIEDLLKVYVNMAKYSLDNYYNLSSEAGKEESKIQERIYLGKIDAINEVLKIINR